MASSFEKYHHIQVSGDDISPVIQGISTSVLSEMLLSKYDLNDIKKGQFYPMTNYLNLLFDIEEKSSTVLKSIGNAIIDNALFPPNIKTFEQALTIADVGYYMNHKGAEKNEIGHYLFEKKLDDSFLMTVTAPYPCSFDQGVISGMARKFNAKISITHNDDSCRTKGDSTCYYKINTVPANL